MGSRRLVALACLVVAVAASPTSRVGPPGYAIEAADWKREEARAKRRPPKRPSRPRIAVAAVKPPLVRHHGRAAWSLDELSRIDDAFHRAVGRPLPISAFGQTVRHTTLGFDHSDAVDVALHPDSSEGMALQELLRDAGVPFIVARRAMHGVSTGAHIHIGPPSRRLTTLAASNP